MSRKHLVSSCSVLLLLVVGLWITPIQGEAIRGPRMDKLRYKAALNSDAACIEMLLAPPVGSDVWSSLVGSADVDELEAYSKNGALPRTRIEDLNAAGKMIVYKPGWQECYLGFNYRHHPLDDVNFRHALAHLLPKDRIMFWFGFTAMQDSPMVPATMSEWLNGDVDSHAYSPVEAQTILIVAGYSYDGYINNWRDPSGSPIPALQVYTPNSTLAYASWLIGHEWVFEMHSIGLSSISQVDYWGPMPWGIDNYLDRVYDLLNFDIFLICESLGRWPDYLYEIAHSSQNYPTSRNPTGIMWPELDAQLDILKFSVDHDAQVAAAKEAQEMLQGGTTSNPLPIPAPTSLSQALPYIPVCTLNYFSALQPELSGFVNANGWGIDNMWTHLCMYWNATGEYRPGTTDKTITWILQDVPRNLSALAVLNPTSARTVYEWAFMDPVFDGLIAVDPWSSCDEPWLATEWTIASYQGPENGYAEGMQVTFTLRTTDSQGQPINWQDGIPISSSDVKFAWEFIRDWQIPRYRTFSKHITNVTLVDSAHIIAFFNITSIWFHYDLARTALMFPPQVWDRSWPNLAAILAYVPTGPYDPAPGYTPGPTPPPTNLFGTGPFAFRLYDPIGLYGDLDANRNYWLTTEEALAKISYYFWRLGDTDLSGDIGPLDLWIMNTHFGEIGVPPGPPGSDITGPPLDPAPLYSPPDGRVDVHDTFTLGKNFGKYLETDP